MQKKVVLMIEDSIDDVNIILNSLKKEKEPNLIIMNFNGKEALASLGEYEGSDKKMNFIPDLIILDLRLPYVDGLDVLAAIRNNPQTRDIPVVVFSSSDLKRDIINSYRNGANSFIRKPVNIERFKEAVKCIFSYWLDMNINTRDL